MDTWSRGIPYVRNYMQSGSANCLSNCCTFWHHCGSKVLPQSFVGSGGCDCLQLLHSFTQITNDQSCTGLSAISKSEQDLPVYINNNLHKLAKCPAHHCFCDWWMIIHASIHRCMDPAIYLTVLLSNLAYLPFATMFAPNRHCCMVMQWVANG